MTDTVSKEVEMHQLIDNEASLKEKTITNSEARRILRSDRGMEFEKVIKTMRAQGRVTPDPEVTYDSIVKDNRGNGKRIWKRSEIRVLSQGEFMELEGLGELGMSGSAVKEGRIFEDNSEPLLSYKMGNSENSIPLGSIGVANRTVMDTEENRGIWLSQRNSYLASKAKNDSTLEILREGNPKPEYANKSQSQVEKVLQGERPYIKESEPPIGVMRVNGVQYLPNGQPIPEVTRPEQSDRIGTVKIKGVEI